MFIATTIETVKTESAVKSHQLIYVFLKRLNLLGDITKHRRCLLL